MDTDNVYSSLKPFANNKQQYEAFLEYVQLHLSREIKALESATDPVDVYRSQGKMAVYRRLARLKEEVLAYEQDRTVSY